ncbi:hypothetical protein BC834DRAFT_674594 [Gloeopeniophorella convolvens]|nr:hypothetical protein BC834DRAFT_674594 [Gloeopeniophorella convolvens]
MLSLDSQFGAFTDYSHRWTAITSQRQSSAVCAVQRHLCGSSSHFETLISGMVAPELTLLDVTFSDHSVIKTPSFPRFVQDSTKLPVPAATELILSRFGGCLQTRPLPTHKTPPCTISLSMRRSEIDALMAFIALTCHFLAPTFSSAEALIVANECLPLGIDEERTPWVGHVPVARNLFHVHRGPEKYRLEYLDAGAFADDGDSETAW